MSSVTLHLWCVIFSIFKKILNIGKLLIIVHDISVKEVNALTGSKFQKSAPASTGWLVDTTQQQVYRLPAAGLGRRFGCNASVTVTGSTSNKNLTSEQVVLLWDLRPVVPALRVLIELIDNQMTISIQEQSRIKFGNLIWTGEGKLLQFYVTNVNVSRILNDIKVTSMRKWVKTFQETTVDQALFIR